MADIHTYIAYHCALLKIIFAQTRVAIHERLYFIQRKLKAFSHYQQMKNKQTYANGIKADNLMFIRICYCVGTVQLKFV